MKRGGPLKRSAMKRSRKRMNPRSKRRQEIERDYAKLRNELCGEGSVCAARTGVCVGSPTQLHHIRSRGRSGRDSDLVSRENVVVVCGRCHDYIETHREWALANGWLRHARSDEERWTR